MVSREDLYRTLDFMSTDPESNLYGLETARGHLSTIFSDFQAELAKAEKRGELKIMEELLDKFPDLMIDIDWFYDMKVELLKMEGE